MLVMVGLLAGLRIWWWGNHVPVFQSGEVLMIETTVGEMVLGLDEREYIQLDGVQVELPLGVVVYPGERVKMAGSVVKTKGVVGTMIMKVKTVEILSGGSWWRKGLARLRQTIVQKYETWLPQREAALLGGIVLGSSERFLKDQKSEFRAAGISHIVAASGYNLTVVAGVMLVWGDRLWGRRKAILLAMGGMLAYVFLAGAGAAVVRAAIMTGLTLGALALGRSVKAGWMLLWCIPVALIIKPEWWANIGFWLSVAATAGLVWVEVGRFGLVVSDLATTMAVSVTTVPLLLHFFGKLSWLAPLANLLVLPTVPVIMGLGGIAGLVGLVLPGVGQIGAWLTWPLLAWITEVAKTIGGFTGGVWTTGEMPWAWVGSYYVCLGLVLVMIKRQKRNISRL